MVFNRWHGAGSCLGLRRGQVGRSERGSWNKTPAKRKKNPPWRAGGFTYGPTAKTLVCTCVTATFVVLPTQSLSVGGSVDARKHLRVYASTHTQKNPALTTSPLAPREKSLETCLCVLFLVNVCLGGVVGVSSVFRALLCSVALCLCLQLRAMYIS